jgi:uncharacterized protein YndB with AHSA1/START domain
VSGATDTSNTSNSTGTTATGSPINAEAPATLSVQREIVIRARPQTVYAFFVDPERLMRWKGIDARIDVRPGGIYRVNVTGQNVARGEYVEVIPNRRLVFTWGWEAPEGAPNPLPPGSSRVEVDLIAEGDATRVRLTHSGLPNATVLGGQTEGWEHYLARLRIVAEDGDPGPDPWVSAPAPSS